MTDTSAGKFDPFEDLPEAMLSIEASAGTGKTYTLAALATRFLAEGAVTAPELLMVTFTRAATGELRGRVRDRLSEAVSYLTARCSGQEPTAKDGFLEWLASSDAPGGTTEDRLERLVLALSEFDSATITTIHGFAAQVLAALGVGSGVAGELRLVDDADKRLVEACSDVLVAASMDPAVRAEALTWDTFAKRVRSVVSSPDIRVTPEAGDPDAEERFVLLARLARRAREVMQDRRRDSGTQNFDDLLVQLRDALGDDKSGEASTRVVRDRYRVALIDEFQDTDPVQWQVFSKLFAPAASGVVAPNGIEDETALVLVGDPKQAIYSFRGADVSTYVRAVTDSTWIERRTLETNWRSDGPVLDATSTLFEGVSFGHGIEFSDVEVAEGHEGQQLRREDIAGQPVPGLEIRCAVSDDVLDHNEKVNAARARQLVAADVTSRAIELLESCTLPDERPGSEAGSTRRLEPKDIAVLVRSNDSAAEMQAALRARGVPAVLSRGTSVVESPAAEQLTWLLEALVRPSDQRRARTFATSWFGGRSAEWVATADEAEIGRIQHRLVEWNSVLTTHGVVEFMRTVWHDSAVVQRLLADSDGDRSVTDLDHLGELLRMDVGDTAVSAAGLLAALGGLRQGVDVQVDTDRDTDVTSRRVESDAEAVQIMTVWVAKGLEFPVVLCPNMWSRPNGSVDYHDPESGERTFDVASAGDAKKRLKVEVGLAEQERSAEEMRLLYVALTRARHHTAVWWVHGRSSASTSLAKVLFARNDDGSLVKDACGASTVKNHLPERENTVAYLRAVFARADGAVVVNEVADRAHHADHWVDPLAGTAKPALASAEFTRRGDTSLQRSRSRWSFSGIVSRDRTDGDPWDVTIDDEGADDEQRPPDVGLGDDAEADDPGSSVLPSDSVNDAPTASSGPAASPLAWLPAGAAFGTLAHDVLEKVDFSAHDLAGEVRKSVQERQRWLSLSLRPVGDDRPIGDPVAEQAGADLLVDGLTTAIRTPLGPLFDTATGTPTRLADIPPTDRLDEMVFELNLAGSGGHGSAGDGATGRAPTDRDIGRLLVEHLGAEDPFRPWAAHLAKGVFRVDLQGHLTGSIDAVIRLRDGTDDPSSDRFVVVDYKTNRLHDHGVDPAPGDYGAAAMERSMMEHHYPLQALLYSVAVHRYLRWRLPRYDPAVNLGGIAYMFLRGMSGPDVPTLDGASPAEGGSPQGVCTWAPPPELVPALSDLLDGRHTIVGSAEESP